MKHRANVWARRIAHLMLIWLVANSAMAQSVIPIEREIVMQCRENYVGKCACPGDGPNCQTNNAYDKQGGPQVFCPGKAIPPNVIADFENAERINRMVDDFKTNPIAERQELVNILERSAKDYRASICKNSNKANTRGLDEDDLIPAICSEVFDGTSQSKHEYSVAGNMTHVSVDCETEDKVIEIGFDNATSMDSLHQAIFASALTSSAKSPMVFLIDTNGVLDPVEVQMKTTTELTNVDYRVESIQTILGWFEDIVAQADQ